LDMKSRQAVPAVSLQDQLTRAAMGYAEYLADNDVFGHEENGTPVDRCEAEGYFHFSGENLAAGNSLGMDGANNPDEAAIVFVRLLIIDEGIPDVGHRVNIMLSVHRSVGIGYAKNFNSDYVNYTVQDFGSR
ncbi:MAG: CAP domain-containing protein, partial [Spirochaetia bacterium]